MQSTLSNNIITTDFHMMPLNDLKFYYQNPRVYSVLHLEHGREPTQEEIFEVMRNEDHVKELKTDIRKSGGLTEAVIV